MSNWKPDQKPRRKTQKARVSSRQLSSKVRLMLGPSLSAPRLRWGAVQILTKAPAERGESAPNVVPRRSPGEDELQEAW